MLVNKIKTKAGIGKNSFLSYEGKMRKMGLCIDKLY